MTIEYGTKIALANATILIVGGALFVASESKRNQTVRELRIAKIQDIDKQLTTIAALNESYHAQRTAEGERNRKRLQELSREVAALRTQLENRKKNVS